jgi:hypothetical protein
LAQGREGCWQELEPQKYSCLRQRYLRGFLADGTFSAETRRVLDKMGHGEIEKEVPFLLPSIFSPVSSKSLPTSRTHLEVRLENSLQQSDPLLYRAE